MSFEFKPGEGESPLDTPPQRVRRVRYSGKNPRRFDQKYKELRQDSETLEKVRARGKTPAGSHVSVLLNEVLEVLAPQPGEIGVDATLGRGGHTRELLKRILPSGTLIALDVDPIELPKTEAILREEGYQAENLRLRHSNFAGLGKALVAEGFDHVDFVLADLGVSSMQIDNPLRGFTFKHEGPLDLRMNPSRGISAARWLESIQPSELQRALEIGADEPFADVLADSLAGKQLKTTSALRKAIVAALQGEDADAIESAVTRVFQALRIAVNDELRTLEIFLSQLPMLLKPGGRVAIITFHSGEDRRVKHAFKQGYESGLYQSISQDVIRPSALEIHQNPRSRSAKLRVAVRS